MENMENKARIAELEEQIKAMLKDFKDEDMDDMEDDGDECEGMSDAEFNMLLEAIAIVVELCETVEEAVAAIRRIQGKVQE